MLLFWSPTCVHCQRLLEEVRAWGARPANGAPSPALVVVSSGSPEESAALGFAAPVLLDERFALARALGASGTPSAVVVDRHGQAGTPVLVGANAILDALDPGRCAACVSACEARGGGAACREACRASGQCS
jgi:hypothetical protein